MMVLIEILHVVDYILEQVVVRETCAGSRFSIVIASCRMLCPLLSVAMDSPGLQTYVFTV